MPSDFLKQTQVPPPVPQLPFCRALEAPYKSQYVENTNTQQKPSSSNQKDIDPPKSNIPTNQNMDYNISGLPQYSTHIPSSNFNVLKESKHHYISISKESPPLPRVPNISSRLPRSSHNLNNHDERVLTLPPPSAFLNVENELPLDNLIDFGESTPKLAATGSKKVHSKVKFSDTVTAFIVPEVKRAVKPPLPSHITDPQRELAESLPLCHPNEDYLKDFAPVRKEGDLDSSESTAPPKIKVVHFGVV